MIEYNNNKKATVLNYPPTRKESTVDVFFGEKVSDPYRWLEDDMSDATAKWVKTQNEVTTHFLKTIPYRKKIQERLEKIYNYERLSEPFREGEYFYFYK